MKFKEPQFSKPKFAYINFFTSPHIKDEYFKLLKYKGAFDFLFILQDHFRITVFDYIGITSSFKREEVHFSYIKKTSNNKLRIPFSLFWKLRKLDPKIVYIQGLGYPHYILLMKCFLKSHTKILVHDHANSIPHKWKFPIFKWADNYIDTYFFSSIELAKDWVDSKLIKSYNKVIQCVEGSSKFVFDPEIKKDKNSFLWVGRLDKNKDPMTVLRAFSSYLKIKPQATLTMFFEEKTLLSKVEKFIEDNIIETQIKLMGTISNNDLQAWYQRSEFFIIGSHKEGGPFSLIEAMACGCIPVVTNIPAFKSMTDQGKCGYLFTPGNRDELTRVLLEIKNEDSYIKRKKVLAQFNKELSHSAIASKIKSAIIA